MEDGDRKVTVAEDGLRAGLTLAADAHVTSDSGKPARFDFQYSTWTLSAALDLPIDRLPERNLYRAALISREVARRVAELSADSIRVALREDLRQTESRLESWRIQQNAVDLATRRIESTDLKLQAGRADTRDLLEAQEALLQARNSVSASLIDYTLSRMALFRDMELLRIDENGIHVEAFSPVIEDPDRAAGAPSPGPSESGSAEPRLAEPRLAEVGA
jgi:outer membrane protein TolC